MTTRQASPPIPCRHGKPLDYGRLGKTFRDGADFMRHLKHAAEEAVARAEREGAVRMVDRCPACGSPNVVDRFKAYGFQYRQCTERCCRHGFVATLIDDSLREAFFRDDARYSNTNYCDPDKAAFRVDQIARPKVDHVLGATAAGASRWLDVGCGTGEVLAVLRRIGGWNAIGLELSPRDAAFGREQYQVDIREQRLDAFIAHQPDARFDVVSFFGVLHCVEDPAALIKEAATQLTDGGLVVTEVAHCDALITRAVETFPDHPSVSSYNGLTTLHQFTVDSIQGVLRSAGLDPLSAWFYGTDVHEVLNQWCFRDARFAGSPLEIALRELAPALQQAVDEGQRSSNMLWIARKSG